MKKLVLSAFCLISCSPTYKCVDGLTYRKVHGDAYVLELRSSNLEPMKCVSPDEIKGVKEGEK